MAKQIADVIDKKSFEKVEVVAGFVNFFVKPETFNRNIQQILKDKNFGKSNHLNGYKIMIEYMTRIF